MTTENEELTDEELAEEGYADDGDVDRSGEEAREVADDASSDASVPVDAPDGGGIEPTHRELLEAGLQDSMDLYDWRMPSVRDYFWYFFVYGVLITFTLWVILSYQRVGIAILWWSYLATLVVLAMFIVRSFNYRRGTYSKSYSMATLDLQQVVEMAIDDVGLAIDFVDRPDVVFLRPLIGVYKIRKRDFTISIEGRSHLQRKVVRVGRFVSDEAREEGRRLCAALDRQVGVARLQRRSRKLFHDA